MLCYHSGGHCESEKGLGTHVSFKAICNFLHVVFLQMRYILTLFQELAPFEINFIQAYGIYFQIEKIMCPNYF